MTSIVRGLTFDTDRTRDDASSGRLLATELADWLVQKRGLPFRDAHGVVGAAIRALETRGLELRHADPDLLDEYSDRFRDLPYTVLSVDSALHRPRLDRRNGARTGCDWRSPHSEPRRGGSDEDACRRAEHPMTGSGYRVVLAYSEA
ncbi:hypothetical protein Q0F99_17700 [Rathayibacter oskolensis]|uniref:hypothetical protein n=1 Tax=Rathayibacter oskolensis TaxID=1891671 RepID=UPI00265EA882|nr:hypothetical protein [Rathayibacter oskolensis]WKK71278.1 hypothetical protein Q0F99_17700 [Rathayibacter oskolensis]